MQNLERGSLSLEGHYQNGYVTHHLDRAVALVEGRYGLTGWTWFDANVSVTTQAGPMAMHVRIASAWAGGLHIEIVEPLGGADGHYRALLPADPEDPTPRLHHLALRGEDLPAMRFELAASGLPMAFSGESPAMVFAYMDARASLGHYLEFVWKAPGDWEKIGWPEGRPLLKLVLKRVSATGRPGISERA